MMKVKKALLASTLGLSIASLTAPVYASTYHAQNTSTTHYIIKKGDTFWRLSKKFNIPLSSLLSANHGVDPRNLQVGKSVNIPVMARNGMKAEAVSAGTTTPERTTVKTASGQAFPYQRVVSAVATAYSSVPKENGGWAGLDYFGNPLQVGTVAVDPAVIPLGSKLYITGYNFSGLPKGGFVGRASDIGGAIRGNRVDLFVPGSPEFVGGFGMQNVKIYILK